MKKILNDLYDYSSMKIYQYDEAFKFSLDSILLAELVQIHKNDRNILDLCTGNAVIPLILSTKTSLSIVGIEYQKEIYELASLSVNYNQKNHQITCINDDILNIDKYFPGNNFDIITCNPPYFKYHNKEFLNHDKLKQIARHEVKITLENVIRIASCNIKEKGNFYMVHICERLQEIMVLLEKYHFRMKDLYFVYPNRSNKAFLVLFRAIKGGNIGMKIHKPIYLDELTTYQNMFKGE
jgi:tRNA1(Val) A37 N6-methylase TrmN6